MITELESLSIRRHGQNRGIDSLSDQRGQCLGRATGLNVTDFSRVDAKVTQSLDGEIMRVAADARNTDAFSFQLLRCLNVRLGDNAVGQQAFDAADNDRVFVTLHNGSSDARRTDHRYLAVAGKNRRHGWRPRSDKNQRNLQIILLEKTGFLGD